MEKEQSGVNRKLILLGLILGMFFGALEQTVVGTAMPTIVDELNGFSIFSWVTTAYLITSTTVVPIIGKLSDMFGRRVLYLLGILIFVLGSGLCATATTMEQLVLYRGLQGLGGGMIMPLSQTIIGVIFSAEQRAKWQGVFGGLFALSSIVGPFIGGFLVDYVSWHWIFLINVPFGLLSGILIFAGLKREKAADTTDAPIDYLGIAVFVPALVLLLLGLTFGGEKFAWDSAASYSIFGASTVLFILFGWVEHRAKEPILDLKLFQNRVFAVSNILSFLLGLGMFGAIMFVPMFMQAIMGVSPTKAGSTMTPMMISMIVASIIGSQILLRTRYRNVLVAGMLITALGFYLMSTMGVGTSSFITYLYMIILGIGMGLVMPTLTIVVQEAFPKSQLGTVTSAAAFFRSIGGTIGVTLFNVVMNHSISDNMQQVLSDPDVASNQAVHPVLAKLAENPDSLFGVMIAPDALKMPEELTRQIVGYVKHAWTDSFSFVFIVGLCIIALGVLTTSFVGGGRIQRDKEKKAVHAVTDGNTVAEFEN
ncbi:MDR family MFS transporter [Thermoflavimicrobium dichotomicum]|uniref:Drug resistance transporter, EmrB/QacA subfamily n=1 Tax=Thermoflavimicrobium dichotomicum TaxID=46223 RepID=A0A1I3UZY6_9BACL|nr:MDR family MFS transporter [Thermoflavimicrobium dichotomicum]SFJ88994.1 drug resistance transporter, EmrB/QacA subfamily [Thermoflavimicrobium dichotomicum]